MSATKPTLTDNHAGGPYSVPPEPKRWPSIALAVGVHALLLAFLVIGVSWQNHEPVAVEAEVWDTTVQTAAPPPPPQPEPEPQPAPETPPPPPQPAPKAVEPPPPPPVEQPVVKQPAPDIALAREKKRKEELKRKQQQEEDEREREQERLDRIADQKRADAKQAKLAADKKERALEEKKEKERELAEQKAKEQKAQEAKELAQKEADDKKKKLEKEKADKLAKAKAEKAEQAKLDKQRQEDLKRMIAAAAGSGSANSTGAAEKSSAPKRDSGYIAAITAAVKSHAAYSGDDPGNPVVTFHVDQLPTGDIMSVRKTKSSGIPAFDDAIERAIKQSSPLPKKKDGTVERSLEINFHMKDMQ